MTMDGIKLFKSRCDRILLPRMRFREHSEHVTAIDLQINIGVNSSCFFLPSYYIFWFYSLVHFIFLYFLPADVKMLFANVTAFEYLYGNVYFSNNIPVTSAF